MEILRLILIGAAIGIANVIPGVSGGTLAVVFNIYDRFINAITYNVKALWNNRGFILPLGAGMATGILIFSKLITVLYTNFPYQTNYFFTGLIIGSLPMLYGFMTKTQEADPETVEMSADLPDSSASTASTLSSVVKTLTIILCALAGFALIITFVKLQNSTGEGPAVPAELPPVTAGLLTLCFFAGFAGAVAMVIPGISGSLIMLILGIYPVIMKCIPAFFVPSTFIHASLLILPCGLGILAGLLSGAKLVAFLLKKAPNHTYAVIFGLICGSAVTLFPAFKDTPSAWLLFFCAICFLAGGALAFFSGKSSAGEK